MAKFSVVIIDTDAASRRSIEGMLKGADNAYLAGSAADINSGYELALRLAQHGHNGADSDPELAFETFQR
jgi:hypothetical protein